MLLAVSIGSNVVVGVIGYLNGTESLKAGRVTTGSSRCATRGRARSSSLFDSIENSLLLASRDSAVIDAERRSRQAFALDGAPTERSRMPPATARSTRQEVEHDRVLARAGGRAGGLLRRRLRARTRRGHRRAADASSFMPASPAARYLLYHYASPAIRGAASSLVDAGDGSAWSAAHAEFHDYLARMAELLDFDDLVLIDTGATSSTRSARASTSAPTCSTVRTVSPAWRPRSTRRWRGQGLDTVVFSDFRRYSPVARSPGRLGVAPLAGDGRRRRRDRRAAAGRPHQRCHDRRRRLGRQRARRDAARPTSSGATSSMRSLSRDLAEDPERVRRAGRGACRAADATLEQAVATRRDPAAAAGRHRGRRARHCAAARARRSPPDYLGGQTIAAYAPFRSHGLQLGDRRRDRRGRGARAGRRVHRTPGALVRRSSWSSSRSSRCSSRSSRCGRCAGCGTRHAASRPASRACRWRPGESDELADVARRVQRHEPQPRAQGHPDRGAAGRERAAAAHPHARGARQALQGGRAHDRRGPPGGHGALRRHRRLRGVRPRR